MSEQPTKPAQQADLEQDNLHDQEQDVLEVEPGLVAEELVAEELVAEESEEVAETVDVEDLLKRLEEAERTVAEQQDSVLRAAAEEQNVRRRAQRDVENAHKFALERFTKDLLPVVDTLERAIEAPAGDDEASQAAREGVELTLKMLLDALKKQGVERLDPVGEPFDPQSHEAMSMQPNPDMEPNTVMAVLQKGYALNGRLIRPAMVMVSKAAG